MPMSWSGNYQVERSNGHNLSLSLGLLEILEMATITTSTEPQSPDPLPRTMDQVKQSCDR